MTRSLVLLGGLGIAILAATPASAETASALFGCDASRSAVCYFRIFYYPKFNRQIVLPAGMKVTVPGLTIGRDRYCVSVGTPPRHGCQSKLIDANYNS